MNKQYTCYKSKNLPGLEVIPEGWNYNKLSRICYMKGRIGWQGLKQSEFTTEGPYLITGMNFKDGKIRWDEVYHITEARYDEAPEIQLKVGDVLMTKDGTIGKLLFVDTLPGKASLNSHLLVLRPLNNNFQPKYLYYLLQSDLFKTHIELNKTGTTFYGLSQEAVGRFIMILPPLKEQEIIVSYLDCKLAKIDELISKKQNLIGLLREEHTAIVNQTVTKGIYPDVEMKESGIAWMGRIPKHWKVTRIKYLSSKISKGTTPSTINKELLSSGSIRFIKAENIVDNATVPNPEFYIDEETNQILKRSQLKEGDLLFVIAGATVGKVSIMKKELLPANTNQAISLIRLNKQRDIKFVWYYLQSKTIQELVRISYVQSAQPNLSMEDLGNFYIPYPSEEEKTEITQFLDEELNKINRMILKTEKEIDLLQEYRTALISEVVTGKIDVREEIGSWT